MGLSKLDIWVSDTDDPCSVSPRTWYVTIYDCDGRVLEWCGRRYVVLPAFCGHLEVDVPPGCYYIKAVWSFSFIGGIYYVNHFTDAAIVQVGCEQHACVKLFNPSIHRCGTIIVRAVQDLVLQKAVKPEAAAKQEAAMKEVLKGVPVPGKLFELSHLDEIEKLVRAQEAKGRK
jgi:hypothetical protein